ncbi:hypothetical protein FA95DRAFT_1503947, partial [Auriscalpium vulgare]
MDTPTFPPKPPSRSLIHQIISNYCASLNPELISESACAVCATIYRQIDLTSFIADDLNMDILKTENTYIARQARSSVDDSILPLDGPLLHDSGLICKDCLRCLKKGTVPVTALANGNWLGDIPSVLQGLSWAEKMLISRVCHNRCVVRVMSSGMHKMSANAVFFSTPTPKVYVALPPKREDVNEIIGFVYIGQTKPTDKDLRRTPLLVRRNKVASALEWLKCNHIDYRDLEISYTNLAEYEEEGVPIVTEYKLSTDGGTGENKSVNIDDDVATTDGACPFTVHALTGKEIERM